MYRKPDFEKKRSHDVLGGSSLFQLKQAAIPWTAPKTFLILERVPDRDYERYLFLVCLSFAIGLLEI